MILSLTRRGTTHRGKYHGVAPYHLLLALFVALATLPSHATADNALPAAAPLALQCTGHPLTLPEGWVYTFIWQPWPAQPLTAQRFDDTGPRGIAIDQTCNVYVADNQNGAIEKFSADGTLLGTIGSKGNGPGHYQNPIAVAVDSTGSVYVIDDQVQAVQKLSPTGQFVAYYGKCLDNSKPCQFLGTGTGNGEFSSPSGLAIDGQGNLYVADCGNNRVQKFSTDGRFAAAWGSEGSGPGQFRCPYSVAIGPDGALYVADLNNYRVQELSATGAFVRQWGSGIAGAGDDQMQQPRGVTVDRNNNVYVSDHQNNRVEEFGPDGSLLSRWVRCEDAAQGTCQFPNSGSGAGEFFFPTALAVDGQGNLWIADTGNGRLQLLYLTIAPPPDVPADASPDGGSPS